MSKFEVILIVFVLILVLFSILKNKLMKLIGLQGRDSITPQEIDLNQILQNQNTVNYFIDKYYYETLFYYLNKEITFDSNSVVKIQAKFKYRTCIRNLMRPNVYYGNLPFKNTFIQRIYFTFVTQVPEDIKQLIYTFNSGYTIDNYWDKKRKPSIQNYIVDYVNKKINREFLEITKDEELAFKNTNIGSEEIDKSMDKLDSKEYANLCSIIYNINDISEGSVKTMSETTNIDKKESNS